MKKTAVFGLLLLLLLTAPRAHRAEAQEDIAPVLNALESPFKGGGAQEGKGQPSIVDFQADFLQESLIASLDRAQKGKGKVSVKFHRPKTENAPLTKFRWEYQAPDHQEIVSDGDTMWVYLPENGQVIVSDIDLSSPSRPNDPVTFLTGLGNLSRDFTVTWASPDRDADGNYILELQPRQPSAMIERMLIVVPRQAVRQGGADAKPVFPMLSTTVYDPSGNRTTIAFRNVLVNRGFPDSFFRFTPPEGVEVLRSTGMGNGFQAP